MNGNLGLFGEKGVFDLFREEALAFVSAGKGEGGEVDVACRLNDALLRAVAEGSKTGLNVLGLC